MKSMRWQDGINTLLGLWMLASSTILPFAVVGGAAKQAAWITRRQDSSAPAPTNGQDNSKTRNEPTSDRSDY